MPKAGFKRQVSMIDLTFVGFGAIFGSGWLLAAGKVSGMAGPAGWLSWVIGGVAVLLLGLVYAELGAAVPRAGGIIRYPLYSHGPLMGYLMGFITLVAFSSLIAIEVEAAREYAVSWWPALSRANSTSPTILGWFFQVALLVIFFLLNYWTVRTFARSNTVITIFKFVVPLLTVVVLFFVFKGSNFSSHGFAPFGASGVQQAVAGGGVIFAYLGLQPIVSMASEAKTPQRTIPIALILSVLLSTIVYVVLQVVFIGAVPAGGLAHGWGGVPAEFSLPFKDIAVGVGFGWLAVFIVIDALISPSGTANIYTNSTSRVVYGWARNGTLFKIFSRIDEKSGIPRPALWLTLALAIFWTLPFPSWDVLVNGVSGALILSYAIAPVSAAAFRRRLPDLDRPFRLKAFTIISPVSFIIASYIVYWTGWSTIWWLLGSQLVMFVLYIAFSRYAPTDRVPLGQQLRSSYWLIAYYVAMLIISALGNFGGKQILKSPIDLILLGLVALGAYYWSVRSALPTTEFDEDTVQDEDPADALPGPAGH